MTKFFTSILVLLLLVPLVSATCSCPSIYRGRDSDRWELTGCNDVELQGECRQGNWELENWIGAIMSYGDAIIRAKMEETPPKDADWVGRNRASLSDAVEHAKQIIDCNKGLFTETRNHHTRSHCFSQEILEQCNKLLTSLKTYQSSVVNRLRELDGGRYRIYSIDCY